MKGIDSTNVVDLTKAEIMGRKLSNYALSAMQAKIPGVKKQHYEILHPHWGLEIRERS